MIRKRPFPLIDVAATGRNIHALRKAHGYSVTELQEYLDLESSQSIYFWQQGKYLPTIDHLYALSFLFDVSIDTILCPLAMPMSDSSNQTSR